jgi:hypothetical protein
VEEGSSFGKVTSCPAVMGSSDGTKRRPRCRISAGGAFGGGGSVKPTT